MSRTNLCQQLRQLGVETVTAEYDGSGDSGQIEEPQFESAKSVKVPRALATTIHNLFYGLLEENHPGWEINEGSYGEFVWNLRQDEITLGHNMREESYEEEVL